MSIPTHDEIIDMASRLMAQMGTVHSGAGRTMDEARKMLNRFADEQQAGGWRPVSEAKKGVMYVGYNAAFPEPFWCGDLSDLVKDALVNRPLGRWRQVTHVLPLTTPTEEARHD